MIASLEGADANKLATYSVFHDIHETRLLDRNGVSQKYFPTPNTVVDKIREDQFKPLGDAIWSNLQKTMKLSEKEFLIVKDADYMEDGLRAKELTERGYPALEMWLSEVSQTRYRIVQAREARNDIDEVRKLVDDK